MIRLIGKIVVSAMVVIGSFFVVRQCNLTPKVPYNVPNVVPGRPQIFDSDAIDVPMRDSTGATTTERVRIDGGSEVTEVVTIIQQDSVGIKPVSLAIKDPERKLFPDFWRRESRVVGIGDTTYTILSTPQRRSLLSFRPAVSVGASYDFDRFRPSVAVSPLRVGAFRVAASVAYSRQQVLYGGEISVIARDRLELAAGYQFHNPDFPAYVALRYRF